MTSRRLLLALSFAGPVVAIALVWLVWRALDPAGGRADRPSDGRLAAASHRAPTWLPWHDRSPDPETASALAAIGEALGSLASALAADDPDGSRAASDALRALLLERPELVSEVAPVLGDPRAGSRTRQGLAAVIGTMPGPAAARALAESLGAGDGKDDPAVERALVLSAGAARLDAEAEDGFDRADVPNGLRIVGGIGVVVDGPIEDTSLRDAVAMRLSDASTPDAGVRWAAARALGGSIPDPEIRRLCLERVALERDGEVQGELGAGLADWIARPGAGADRSVAADRLLEVAARPDAGALRFRIESALGRAPLDESQEARLAAQSADADPGTRLFALQIAGSRLRADGPTNAALREAAQERLRRDPHPKVRAAAARALAGLASRDPKATVALEEAAKADREPSVRAAAAAALGRGVD